MTGKERRLLVSSYGYSGFKIFLPKLRDPRALEQTYLRITKRAEKAHTALFNEVRSFLPCSIQVQEGNSIDLYEENGNLFFRFGARRHFELLLGEDHERVKSLYVQYDLWSGHCGMVWSLLHESICREMNQRYPSPRPGFYKITFGENEYCFELHVDEYNRSFSVENFALTTYIQVAL